MATENCVSIPADEYRRLIAEEVNGKIVRNFLRRVRERGYGVSYDEITMLCDLFSPTESGEGE